VQSGKGQPENHVSMNVALYGRGARRWAMTERGTADLQRTSDTLGIGPSSVRWDGDCLAFDIEEVGAVFGEKVRGTVKVYPEALVASGFQLDSEGRHRWQPIATRSRIEVVFQKPGISWSGDAYVDSNFGSEPMENRFREWQWSRAHGDRGTAVFYEGTRLDGSSFALSLNIDRQGVPHLAEMPKLVRLRPTGWLMPRSTRSEGDATVVKTWEDAPFYSRSTLGTRLHGENVMAVHESLSLTRFISPVVQFMLPFRMPRRA
jgi:carotenoid 1,2-hydratase